MIIHDYSGVCLSRAEFGMKFTNSFILGVCMFKVQMFAVPHLTAVTNLLGLFVIIVYSLPFPPPTDFFWRCACSSFPPLIGNACILFSCN